MGDSRYLAAREAAGELGVSLSTLYAYVSRGLIRSEASAGTRRDRRYRAEDVRRLKERKEQRRDPARATEGALDWGSPVMESAITLISEGRMYYRGHDAVALSGRCSLEQVAALIWTGDMENLEGAELPRVFWSHFGLAGLQVGEAGEPLTLEAFGRVLLDAAAADPAAYDLRGGAVARTGARILRLLVAAATGVAPDGGQSVARILRRAWAPQDAGAEALLDRALVLCADHELNVSSFTARCVASAGATPYAVVVAGLAALGGVKHGGNIARVEAFLAEVERGAGAQSVVSARLKRAEAIPGFGHQLYPDGDPRGGALLAALAEAYPDSPELRMSMQAAEAVGDLMGESPNVDFGLAVLAGVLDLPPGGALALFALGRTVGWVGHAIEQYESDSIIRPRARYVGRQPPDG